MGNQKGGCYRQVAIVERCLFMKVPLYSKTCLKRSLKGVQKWLFKTGSLLQVRVGISSHGL